MISARCELRLAGVHPDLVRVVRRAAEGGVAFRVEEGLRTVKRQKQLVAAGASQTMNSRHITGHATSCPKCMGTWGTLTMIIERA